MVIFFEKTMKRHFKAIIWSLKIYENILKFNFLMGGEGGIGHIDCFHRFLKRSFIDVKTMKCMVIYNHTKIPLNWH